MSYANPFTGHIKSRGIGDAFGIAPDLKHSIETIIGRIQKAEPVPNGHRNYLVMNGGHSYTAKVSFDGTGKPSRFEFFKTRGSSRHGMAMLAKIDMAYVSGCGCQWVFTDNFNPISFGIHAKHSNKLKRRMSIIAHAPSVMEIGGTDTW